MSMKPKKLADKIELDQSTKKASGAQSSRTTVKGKLDAWKQHHKQSFKQSYKRLLATPIATFLTILVIGIALALPIGMLEIIKNVYSISKNWDDIAQISLFLETDLSAAEGRKLTLQIGSRDDVSTVEYVSSQQAMEEFQQTSGLGNVLEHLDENPLPGVIIVEPKLEGTESEQAEVLLEELKKLKGVEYAQLDLQWVKRLFQIMHLGQRLIITISILLGLAVLLVIGNTIRLEIESRKEEVIIVKLVGATDAFVQRPFLYAGFWYGLGSGIMACLLISGSLLYISGPVSRLATLYNSDFNIQLLPFDTILGTIATSVFLGWFGAWLAVKRHLDALKPQ